MEIIQQIEHDFNQALKKKEEAEVSALRLIKSAIKNAEIAARPEELDEEQAIKTLRALVKQRQEAIELYQQGNRQDLAEKEKQEIEIIKRYLPAELDESVVREIIKKAVAEVQPTSLKELGKVMGKVMPEIKGQMGGDKVSQLVKEELEKILKTED